MGRRLKFHITATISPEAGEYLEWVADQLFNGNRSEALDMLIKFAKENGFHIVGQFNNKK
jgi:hypothetical protein